MIDLKPEYLEEVRAILDRCVPDCEVLAFGSRVEGRARKHSDLDLIVKAEQPLPLQRLAQLRECFMESALPIRVDVSDWHAVSPGFRARILHRHEPVLNHASSHVTRP
ncbi:MAG: nucleotidyltransferase domain-containing protein [Opitutaceae bacterium]|jgi:predicted nucleotidyltransferase|nr:nucleotidyltransferase domain-containing protein [Opitutaceae bacterium]